MAIGDTALFLPANVLSTTVERHIPSTHVLETQSKTYNPEHFSIPPLPKPTADIFVRASPESKCTTTFTQDLPFSWGPTKTVWAHTSTFTGLVPCSGCSLKVDHEGNGPIVQYTTTETLKGTKTVYAVGCEPSPSGSSCGYFLKLVTS